MTMALEERLQVGQRVRVELPAWLQRRNSLFSRVMDGTVLAVTQKAIRFEGRAAVVPSRHCMRCGRTIENPASIKIGYGPFCALEIGAHHEGKLDPQSEEQVRAAIAQMGTVELWLPLSRINVEVLENDPAPDPVSAGNEDKEDNVQGRQMYASQPDARITIEGGRIVCRSHFRYKDRCKAVQGARWDKNRKAWTYPVSPAVAEALRSEFAQFQVEMSDEFLALLDAARAIEEAAEHKTAAELPPVPVTKTDAWLHQRQAFWFVTSVWGYRPEDLQKGGDPS